MTDTPGGRARHTVVHVITTLDIGGAQSLLLDIARHIDRSKYEILIAFLHGEAPEIDDPRISVTDFSGNGTIRPFAFVPMARWMRRVKADLVHTHLVHADLLGRWAARLARVKRVVMTRHYGIDNKQDSRMYKLADRSAKGADAVVAVSRAVASHLVERGIVPSSRIAVIPNGIDLNRFDPAKYPPKEDAQLVVGAVGRLHPQKGFGPLLEIWKQVVEKVPGAVLEIIGEGPLRPQLESRVIELGLVRSVRLPGRCLPQELPARYASWDLFVTPSRWQGFGMTAAEAMAMRLPVVASTVEGHLELVDDGATGRLVSPAAPEAWVEAIVALLHDPAQRASMGEAGRDRVMRHFGIDDSVRRLERLYDQLFSY